MKSVYRVRVEVIESSLTTVTLNVMFSSMLVAAPNLGKTCGDGVVPGPARYVTKLHLTNATAGANPAEPCK